MYNEEKLYSVRSLVVVHILNFQRDLVFMWFIRFELITRSRRRYVVKHNLITEVYLMTVMEPTDRLCGLVVRVSGYRYRGPGFDPRRYQIF